MTKESEKQAKYDAKMTRRYSLKLNKNTDSDIIEKLDSVRSVQGYIKEAIRRDLDRETEETSE